MPNKTERILSYLPSAFRVFPRQPALFTVADTFGNELTQAENSLAAVMLSHWVDFADKNAPELHDLRLFAALYGLTPREEESIEEFRDHLKRYVRTFLEGTVTVQGVLRVAAEALGLRIADSYADLDTWWKRPNPDLITVEPAGADAAAMLFGRPVLDARGAAAQPARVGGPVDPARPSNASTLLIKVDALAPKQIDLPSAATGAQQIANAINTGFGQTIATAQAQTLTLTSPTLGPDSRLEILDTPNDAAGSILGLAPRVFLGSGAQPARITSSIDLATGANLGDARYLRLTIDGATDEIDLGGAGALTLDQLKTAINEAFNAQLANHDGHFLTIVSPSTGLASRIVFADPAGQDARDRIFGNAPKNAAGLDAAPAQVTGSPDLSAGLDLSAAEEIRVRIDNAAAVRIHCAGADPSNTQLAEIVTAINAALKSANATHNGRNVILTSAKTGAGSSIVFESLPAGDASQAIFGVGPRVFTGAAEITAHIAGSVDLSAGVDVRTQPLLSIAIDHMPAVTIDVATGAAHMSPADLAASINTALKASIASTDGAHLILTSPTSGAAGRIGVQPPSTTQARKFVTRASIIGEAQQAIFGASSLSAQGARAQSASLTGDTDLSHGTDLRDNRYLRLAVDRQPAVEIDCAGDRPRATLLTDIVGKINQAAPGQPASSGDGRRLTLTSPSSGAGSRITIQTTRSRDALDTLLGVAPATYRGAAASGVVFVGLVDLSAGIDLDPKAAINIRVDGGAPTEISLAGDAPNHKTLGDLIAAISAALGAPAARTDGAHLMLASPTTGASSSLEFSPPAGADVTTKILGVPPGRAYHGADASPARIVGVPDLSAGADLHVARNLRLGLDDRPTADIDCTVRSDDPAHASLDQIAAALALVLGPGVASQDGKHLILTSRTRGPAASIIVERHTSGDAATVLLGSLSGPARGQDPTPAVIARPPLAGPVDLSRRAGLRISVDGGPPVDINVAGAIAAKTSAAEIIAAINQSFPGLADLTADSRIRLTSPTAGETSALTIAPLRYLELIEYPPTRVSAPPQAVASGSSWPVTNRGAADSFAEITISATTGASRPMLVNRTTGWALRFTGLLNAGQELRIWRDAHGRLNAEIISPDGARTPVDAADLSAGPLGVQKRVPFDGSATLTVEPDGVARLQLNNPTAGRLVALSGRADRDASGISISVEESNLAGAPAAPTGGPARLIGRVQFHDHNLAWLRGPAGQTIAQLRSAGDPLTAYRDRVVIVTGVFYPGATPALDVEQIARSFHVHVSCAGPHAPPPEDYPFVTIGEGTEADSLATLLNAGASHDDASQILKAEEFSKSTALALPRGKSAWLYLDCDDSRFDQARFNYSSFAGGACREQGVFNVSRFAPAPGSAVFASRDPRPASLAIGIGWRSYQAGAFTLNLPGDLPETFGGRFNQARFGQTANTPEEFDGAVTEPATAANPKFLVNLINNLPSALVTAALVSAAPAGFTPARMPFRKAQFLGGGATGPAKLYLAEEGLNGFIELTAREPGAWGNQVGVSARLSGPATYDVSLTFEGARFENAREIARGPDLPSAIPDLLQPAPIGVLQAKAAGVLAEVTRDGVTRVTSNRLT